MRKHNTSAERHRRKTVAEALKPLGHPTRLVLLAEFAERGELSAAGLTRALAEAFEFTPKFLSPHLHAMHQAHLIRQSRTRRVRGATEYFYELTDLGQNVAEAVSRLDDS